MSLHPKRLRYVWTLPKNLIVMVSAPYIWSQAGSCRNKTNETDLTWRPQQVEPQGLFCPEEKATFFQYKRDRLRLCPKIKWARLLLLNELLVVFRFRNHCIKYFERTLFQIHNLGFGCTNRFDSNELTLKNILLYIPALAGRRANYGAPQSFARLQVHNRNSTPRSSAWARDKHPHGTEHKVTVARSGRSGALRTGLVHSGPSVAVGAASSTRLEPAGRPALPLPQSSTTRTRNHTDHRSHAASPGLSNTAFCADSHSGMRLTVWVVRSIYSVIHVNHEWLYSQNGHLTRKTSNKWIISNAMVP